MTDNDRDESSLLDMARAIRRIQEFTADFTEDMYLENALVQSAVERQLGILGEAAGRISDDFRQQHPEIEWRKIVGLRNVLTHRYDDIRQETVWLTVVKDLEPLQTKLMALSPPE